MQKFLYILLLLTIPFTTIFAQSEGGVVEGKVIDNKSKEPLGFVTIALIPDGATAPVAGCNSDDEGAFLISNVKAGKYKLRVSFVGYLDDTRSITIKKGEDTNLHLFSFSLVCQHLSQFPQTLFQDMILSYVYLRHPIL